MKLTFLGTGTSYGVPFVACDCDVCQSDNSRNKRLRASILIDDETQIDAKSAASSTRILVDTTPDLRQQLLRERVRHLSAVFWTHSHNDHIIGLDDLRPLCDIGGYIDAFADAETSADLQRVFAYALQENREHGGFPRVKLREAKAFQSLKIGAIRVTPLPVFHGTREIFAYRFEIPNSKSSGENPEIPSSQNEYSISESQENERENGVISQSQIDDSFDENSPTQSAWREISQRENANDEHANRVLVYATDCSQIPEKSREMMRDADVLVLGALRHKAHPAHFTLEEALRQAEDLRAKIAIFTHIAHDLDHDFENAKLPTNRHLAFDGLQIEV